MRGLSGVVLGLGMAGMAISGASAHAAVDVACTSAREFITSYRFMTDSLVKLPADEARKLGEQVAKGCGGAADRFIRVTRTMIRAGMTPKDSVALGVELSGKRAAEVDSFLAIFRVLFLREYMDLDLPTSVRTARSLMGEFRADIEGVRRDFEQLAGFCARSGRSRTLDLPKGQCADFAVKIARAGQKHGGGIAEPFIDLYEFLVSKGGPALGAADALSLAESLLQSGAYASRNFIDAYQFGTSKNGLKLDSRDAIGFARGLAALSVVEEKDTP